MMKEWVIQAIIIIITQIILQLKKKHARKETGFVKDAKYYKNTACDIYCFDSIQARVMLSLIPFELSQDLTHIFKDHLVSCYLKNLNPFTHLEDLYDPLRLAHKEWFDQETGKFKFTLTNDLLTKLREQSLAELKRSRARDNWQKPALDMTKRSNTKTRTTTTINNGNSVKTNEKSTIKTSHLSTNGNNNNNNENEISMSSSLYFVGDKYNNNNTNINTNTNNSHKTCYKHNKLSYHECNKYYQCNIGYSYS